MKLILNIITYIVGHWIRIRNHFHITHNTKIFGVQRIRDFVIMEIPDKFILIQFKQPKY